MNRLHFIGLVSCEIAMVLQNICISEVRFTQFRIERQWSQSCEPATLYRTGLMRNGYEVIHVKCCQPASHLMVWIGYDMKLSLAMATIWKGYHLKWPWYAMATKLTFRKELFLGRSLCKVERAPILKSQLCSRCTARSRENETRNARRNGNQNPRWSKFMSLFKWAVWKETWDDHQGFQIAFWWPWQLSSSRDWAV